MSRDDKQLDVIANFDDILSDVVEARLSQTPTGCCWQTALFLRAALWASTVECIHPVTELFLYAHNWHFSLRTASVIVFSEVVNAKINSLL